MTNSDNTWIDDDNTIIPNLEIWLDEDGPTMFNPANVTPENEALLRSGRRVAVLYDVTWGAAKLAMRELVEQPSFTNDEVPVAAAAVIDERKVIADHLRGLSTTFAHLLIRISDDDKLKVVVQLCLDVADACSQTELGDQVALLGHNLDALLEKEANGEVRDIKWFLEQARTCGSAEEACAYLTDCLRGVRFR